MRRGDNNNDIDLKDYTETVRYLEKLQEVSLKAFSAEFHRSGAEISEDRAVDRDPVSPAPYSMYRPGGSGFQYTVPGTKVANHNHDSHVGSLAPRIREYNNFNSFNQPEIGSGVGGEKMISSERGGPTMFDYHYTHNTHGGMSTTGRVNFAGASNTQNGFAAENSTASFSQGVGNGCLSPIPQNCPQPASMNPLAGLTELAEKANFASELAEHGVAESRFSSQRLRGQINRPAVQYCYPEPPRGRSWPTSSTESANNFYNGRQQPLQADNFSPSGSSVLSDSELGSPCQPTRSRHFFPYSESDTEISPTEANPFDRSRVSYQNYNSRSFANYRLWSNQAESITPNVTVVSDPRSKHLQLFKSGSRTKSEEILKEHLQNFAKFLPPQAEKEDEKTTENNEKSWSNEDTVKEKKPSTVASIASAKESTEENAVFPCKWIGCDRLSFSEQDDLVRHIEKVHIDQRKADDLYICYWKDCSRQRRAFNARYKLVIHMRVHSGEKPNKCTVRTSALLLNLCLFCIVLTFYKIDRVNYFTLNLWDQREKSNQTSSF